MASPLDRPVRKVSRALIQKFGVPVSFTLKAMPAAGSYDAESGTAPEGADVSVTTRALVTPHKARVQQTGGEQAGANQATAREANWTVPAEDFTTDPKRGDEAVLNGNRWRCEGATPVYSGEQVAIWELHMAR